ncbi:MAG: tRNA (adenosine(37)-N6)-threonylcarbamoyltransferase complex transferase subunit TsaD [Patescibacteria group bacterium]
MRILGIETSCDETSVAIVEGQGERVRLKAQLTNSQMKEHAKFGGVVPEVAARRHVEFLMPMLERVVTRDGKGIDAVAVTYGPGLVGALRVGVESAKTLATIWDKPLIGVNHLEGHIYANWLDRTARQKPIVFPALCLIVSGGHTEIIFMPRHGMYELVGETRDDAAGEAFDKVAKMLGLGYPGGPEVAKMALKGDEKRFDLPRPMLDSDDFDFSFSGLKTAVLYTIRELKKNPSAKTKADLCASFQAAAVGVLVGKTTRAIEQMKPKTVLLGGGVSANVQLRKKLGNAIKKSSPKTLYVIPPMKYTTDNAGMIAAAGYFKLLRDETSDPLTLEADPNLSL